MKGEHRSSGAPPDGFHRNCTCDTFALGLRRMERSKHVVFFRCEAGGILVSRILHQRMLPERHAIDDEDET
jgi:plasmid stabilization system protein ParE